MKPREYAQLVIETLKSRGCQPKFVKEMAVIHCDMANAFFATRVTYLPFQQTGNKTIRIKSTAFFDEVKKVILSQKRILSHAQEKKMILQKTENLCKSKKK